MQNNDWNEFVASIDKLLVHLNSKLDEKTRQRESWQPGSRERAMAYDASKASSDIESHIEEK